MKKTVLSLFAAMTLMLSSCMTAGMGTTSTPTSSSDVLGSVLGAVLSNVLFGGQSGILGSWNYTAPSTAFTTQQALTNAGGTAAVPALLLLPTSTHRWQVATTASASIAATLLSRSLTVTSSRLR